MLSGRGLCNELITRPEESYQLWCVVCDLETSRICASYIYDISSLRVNDLNIDLYTFKFLVHIGLFGMYHSLPLILPSFAHLPSTLQSKFINILENFHENFRLQFCVI